MFQCSTRPQAPPLLNLAGTVPSVLAVFLSVPLVFRQIKTVLFDSLAVDQLRTFDVEH